jgi:site-specific recombinase XerD
VHKNKDKRADYSTADAYGVLGQHAQQYIELLRTQKYNRSSISQYKRCLAHLGHLIGEMRVEVADLDEVEVVELVTSIGKLEGLNTSATFIAKRFVRFLADQGLSKPLPPPTPKDVARAELRRDYEAYLRRQRGLSERTIFHCWRFADRFVDFCFGDEIGDLATITPNDIVRFLQHLTTRRRSPLRDRTPPTHLRNFFRYLFKAGKTPVNLAAGVPNIRRCYGARLPRHLTAEQVEVVLEAVRSGSPEKVRRRNYAMVLLLARLALRGPEVIAMQVDDIDWRAGEIVVRGKGHLHDRLPLRPDVGEALAEYIRFERPPTASRTLFVTSRAPYPPFEDSQVLNAILKDAFTKTGLKPPAPYVGSHVLRHSLASHMARQGASLDEIGDVLRHRSRASTLIYAKLDIEGLRSIAQPWPVAEGAQ